MAKLDRDEALSADRARRIQEANKIAARYDQEAATETLKLYAENFRRIAASWRQLAKDLSQ